MSIPRDRILQCSKVKPRTLQLYHNAVSGFLEWAKQRRKCLGSHEMVDEHMSGYIHHLCENGSSMSDASYAIFGFILLRSRWHIPDKLQFPVARQALKGWKSRFPGKVRTGVDLALWDLVALGAFQLGFKFTACAILVQGDCYLRPCEVLGLTKRHLIRPQRRLQKWGVVVGLEEDGVPSKTGEFDECVFADTASRSDVNSILSHLARRPIQQSLSVFHPLTASDYNAQIAKSAVHVGLQHLHLTAHMLRHSGASHDSYYQLRTLKEIQYRGRWKAVSSVARYKKPGKMLLSQQNVSSSVWKRADAARPELIASLNRFFSNWV